MQNQRQQHVSDMIIGIVEFFEDHVGDSSSLIEIKACLKDGEFGTKRARNIFNSVRQKTLKAERKGWSNTLLQRSFEEECAKAIYNFGRPSAPYDPDAQFWIVPLSFQLADNLNLPKQELLSLFQKSGRQ